MLVEQISDWDLQRATDISANGKTIVGLAYDKAFKQLKAKPIVMKIYEKNNAPKKRSCGVINRPCKRCGRIRAHISSYGLHLCRQCFRQIAPKLGFKKYS